MTKKITSGRKRCASKGPNDEPVLQSQFQCCQLDHRNQHYMFHDVRQAQPPRHHSAVKGCAAYAAIASRALRRPSCEQRLVFRKNFPLLENILQSNKAPRSGRRREYANYRAINGLQHASRTARAHSHSRISKGNTFTDYSLCPIVYT